MAFGQGRLMSRVFAYCRVSTVDQTTANQIAEITSAGFAITPKRVVAETVSGSSALQQRLGFMKLNGVVGRSFSSANVADMSEG